MWNRKELKSKSKQFLKRYMLKAILACLIFSLVEGLFSGHSSSGDSNTHTYNQHEINEIQHNFPFERFDKFGNSDGKYDYTIYNKNVNDNVFSNKLFSPNNPLKKFVTISVTGTLLAALIITGFLGSIFILKPMKIGLKRFFLNGYRDEARVADMFTTFTDGHWVGYSLKLLYVEFIIFLWTLLLIIPGIVKGYQYYYVPYILSDHPEYSAREAMALSREMSDCKKSDIFMLDLSFIPWILVAVLTFGLGFLILTPYIEGTSAALYLHEINEPVEFSDYEY